MNQHGLGRPTTFASALLSRRQAAKLSQRELAERVTALGVKMDSSTLHRMEHGHREPKLSEALALSRLLHFDLSDLVTAVDTETAVTELLVGEANRVVAAVDELGYATIEYITTIHELHEGDGERARAVALVRQAIYALDYKRQNDAIVGFEIGLGVLVSGMDQHSGGRFSAGLPKLLSHDARAQDVPPSAS